MENRLVVARGERGWTVGKMGKGVGKAQSRKGEEVQRRRTVVKNTLQQSPSYPWDMPSQDPNGVWNHALNPNSYIFSATYIAFLTIYKLGTVRD